MTYYATMMKMSMPWKDIATVWLFWAITLFSQQRNQVKACTVFVVGKDASVDGSVMCSHSNDGEFDTDPRLVKVPGAEYKPGDRRPIFFSPENYPRYVG